MKDIYQFEINSNGCNYEIWLNEIRIDIQKASQPIAYNLPVNQWLKSGNNKVKIIIFPLYDDPEILLEATYKLKIVKGILINDNIGDKSDIVYFESPDFKSLKEKTPELKLNVYVIEGEFFCETDINNGVFTSLEKLDCSIEELQSLYFKVYNLFKNKDAKSLLSLMEIKISEFSKAYYDSYNEEVNRQKDMLEVLFEKDMEELDFSDHNITYFLDKKVVCLEDEFGYQPIIFVEDFDDDLIATYPFYFAKRNGNNDWIVVF